MLKDKKQLNNTPEKLITLLGNMQQLFENNPTRDEFVALTKSLMQSLGTIEKRIMERVAINKDISDDTLKSYRKDFDKLNKSLTEMIERFDSASNKKLDKAITQFNAEVKILQDMVASVPRYDDRLEEIESKIPEELEELPSEEQAEYTRNLLESIDEEDDKLSIDAIGYLREELDKIKLIKVSGQNNSIVGRDIIKPYDLSASLDGVTKTFNIPANWTIVSVACSSFPNILRPIIDYTWTQQSITFTSEIDASTTLATGQTVIITYVTA